MKYLFIVIFYGTTSLVSVSQIPTGYHVEALNDLLGRNTSAERRTFKLLGGTKMYAYLMGTEYYFDLKDIVCLAGVNENEKYGQVGFYTNDNAHTVKSISWGVTEYGGVVVIPYVSIDKISQIISRVNKLFESLKIPVPAKECAWYKNDATYFETYQIKILKGDGVSPNTIWGTNSSQTGRFVFKYPNGKLRCTRNLKNGICEAEQIDYYENGKIMLVANYASGLLTGVHTFYYVNGQMGDRYYYKNGKKEGLHEMWNSKGQKTYEQLYVNDAIKTQKRWDDNGTLVSDETF